MITYAEKLRDPRWQRKRLEVLNRDNFACTSCGDTTETLHVHLGKYAQGGDPWDAATEHLFTLCESCHDRETRCRAYEEKLLLDTLRRHGFFIDDVLQLACGIALGLSKETHENRRKLLLYLSNAMQDKRVRHECLTSLQKQEDTEVKYAEPNPS